MEMRFKTSKPMRNPIPAPLLVLACILSVLCLTSAAKACCPEDTCDAIVNPFIRPVIYHESVRAEWRHTFTHMRRTWDKYFEVYPKELEGFNPTTLDKVRAEPAFFLDQNIQLDVYFGKNGSIYRPFTAPFHEDGYVNFSAWGYGSELWLKESREQIHLLFYVDRRRKELVEKLAHIPMYTAVHLWVQERSRSENTPWMEIKGAEIIPETALRDTTLRHMELGAKQMARKRFDLAAQSFEAALKLQMPVNAEARAWALLARSYFELRCFSAARNAYAEALIRDESNVQNLIFLARSDEQLQHYDEALQASEIAVKYAPANPEARAELGLALAMLGDDKAGFRELDFAQKLAPRNQLPEAHRNRGVIYIKEGKLDLAKQELSQAVILRAADPVLHMELGEVLLTMNQLEDAKREFNFAKDLSPNRAEPYMRFAIVAKLQGDAAKKDNKLDDAKKFYTEALDNARLSLKVDDMNSDARALELDMLHELGREKEAEKSADTALARMPGNVKYAEALYDAATKLGHWDTMERAATLAVKIKPDGRAFSRLANVLASRPNPDLAGAAANYELALKVDADNGSAWFELAQIRRAMNNVEGAISAADRASEIMKSPEARTLAARARLDRETADPASIDLAKVLADEAKDDATRAQAQSILGAALFRTGNLDGALEAFAKSDALMKDNADQQFWYGMALLQKNDVEAAKLHLKSAVDLSRNGSAQNATSDRLSQKAIEQIEKLEPGYGNKLPDPGKMATKIADKPAVRKVLPPVIEDDGPQPIQTDANRNR